MIERFSTPSWQLAVFIVIVLTLCYGVSAVFAWKKLRHFPGPFLASFSYLWLFRAAVSGKAYKIHLEARRRFGKGLIRIGPEILITDDAQILQHINGVRSGYTKDSWYSVMRLDPYVHSMISTQDVAFHDDEKSKAASAYSGRDVPSMENDLDGQILNLKNLIRRKYLSTASRARPMDWGVLAQYFTVDSLTTVAYGEEFGGLATDTDMHGYMQTVEENGILFALCSDVPWMGKLFLSSVILNFLGPKKTDTKGMGLIMALGERVVNARFGPKAKSGQDMLGSFVRRGMSQKQCEAEILTALVAGSDTTANSLRMGLFLLATTPRVHHRLQKEIDDAIAKGAISSPITATEARGLPYLQVRDHSCDDGVRVLNQQAFIWESLRYHPPVALLFPKVVPPEGDTLDGQFVPGGTKVAFDSWSFGRRTDIYGADAEVFRPERFLEVSPDRRTEMEKNTELLFGFGRYMCAGKVFAFMELNKVFVELLRDFDFQVLHPERPYHISQRAMFVIRDMWMRVTERPK